MTLFSMEFSNALLIFLISMTPVVELRGAIPYGAAIGLPAWETIVLAIAGNMILTPIIILCIRKGLDWLKTVGIFRRFAEWSERRVLKQKGVLEKYELIGLAVLVAIPLPGTGAWTGAMLAGLLDWPQASCIFSMEFSKELSKVLFQNPHFQFQLIY